ncbi:hypothetical protein [Acidovorax temperans]|uniref:hypothetical protein n=1 Tax=Acidovorax temperans TaxID=80878 RepID=UPI0030CDE57D
MRFKFKTVHKTNLTSREKVAEIDLSAGQLGAGSWVLEAVKDAADRSLLKPVQQDIPRRYRRAILGLATDIEWLRVARCSLEELTVDKVVIAMRQVDAFVTNSGASVRTRYSISDSVRQLMRNFAKARNVPRSGRLSAFYKSPHKAPSGRGRKMISDSPSPGTEHPHPIGAIPFDSAEELRAKTVAKIVSTLGRIEAAAVSELDEHAAQSVMLDRLLGSIEVDPELLSRIQQLPFRHYPAASRLPVWFAGIPARTLAAAYYQICSQALTHGSGDPFQLISLRSKDIGKWLTTQGQVGCNDFTLQLLRPRLLSMPTLNACLLILQKHTGWNVNAVLEMGEDGIQSDGKGGYVIQGYKGRLQQPTPLVEILPSDEAPRRAVELLLDRLAALRRLGWVPNNDGRLWLNEKLAKAGRLETYCSWSRALKFFIEKHGLPDFSAEQVRVEVLALEGVEKGGLEAARHRAGHARLSTTAAYLDQILLERLNSAYSLEFERRLEASVRFRMGEDNGFDVSKDLLYPIGDGTSCSDPHNPPDPEFLDRAICAGKDCHKADGCPNRRLIFDENRVEEVFRMKYFYEKNWQDLQNENGDEFVAVHVPAILVNLALVGILEKSAYRHIVNKIRRSVYE